MNQTPFSPSFALFLIDKGCLAQKLNCVAKLTPEDDADFFALNLNLTKIHFRS